MRHLVVLLVLCSAAPALAQVQSRPSAPPIVTADQERWYQTGDPVQFAGDVYHRAGASVFFNGNTMVRTGHFNGVPLYADTTLEPYSIVYVPVGRGQMQPYERLRRGDLAGTTGSRTPSFPVEGRPDGDRLPAAAFAPTAGIADAAPFDTYRFEYGGGVPMPSSPQVAPVPVPAPYRGASGVLTLLRPQSNDGVWISYAGSKWVSAGAAVPMTDASFRRAGEYAGFAVFTRGGAPDVIYLPTRAGQAAPYRRLDPQR